MFTARQHAPDSGWVERRDQRHKVLLRARMRAGGMPVDVCINNVSTRGLCAMTATPPPRGTFVELVDIPCPLVGQVVWSSQRRFGIAVSERIDLARFLTEQRGVSAAQESANQLRASVKKPSPAPREELSREAGQAMQFRFVVAAMAVAAVLIGRYVYINLSQATDAVAAGLELGR